MFLFKKLVSVASMPLMLALGLLLLALLLRLLSRQRASTMVTGLAVLWVFLASWAPVADALLAPLESRHAPLLNSSRHGEVRTVMVLGGGFQPETRLPITSQVGATALTRLTEGIRLYRQLPSARLVVSGGAVFTDVPMAMGYHTLALGLGVNPADIVTLEQPRDTGEEARALARQHAADEPFFLVTSASHMPRAMRHFEAAGLQPIAAPTRHRSMREDRSRWDYWVPQARHLRKTERAIHEYLGLLVVGLEH